MSALPTKGVPASAVERLALGGAQFGLPYGISNRNGAIEANSACEIMEIATQAGIRTVDTAMAYGISEEVLGRAGAGSWRIQTKLPALPPETADVSTWVESSVRASLERLRASQIDTLFLHQPSDLHGQRGVELREALYSCRDSGLASRLGVSIYDPSELDELLTLMSIDVVQAPLNILDRRMIATGAIQNLSDLGIAIHARSIFLQGLLLMPQHEQNRRFPEWEDLWSELHEHLRTTDTAPLEACMSFALSVPEIEFAIIGVSSLEELTGVISAASSTKASDFPSLHTNDAMLIDPRKWANR
jgi:aryl-alcohol dehydrogenase-like predicted oxidoreductase